MSTYPPVRTESYHVCPHCKREVKPLFVNCDGYVFPGDWACPEHGGVIPLKSAVMNEYPASAPPDWSAA